MERPNPQDVVTEDFISPYFLETLSDKSSPFLRVWFTLFTEVKLRESSRITEKSNGKHFRTIDSIGM